MNTKDTQTQTGKGRRELQGVVVSDRMQDTVVVRVSRFVRHPRYGKFIEPSKRYKAHDAGNTCAAGDYVTIRETQPISKQKRFVVVKRTPATYTSATDNASEGEE